MFELNLTLQRSKILQVDLTPQQQEQLEQAANEILDILPNNVPISVVLEAVERVAPVYADISQYLEYPSLRRWIFRVIWDRCTCCAESAAGTFHPDEWKEAERQGPRLRQ